MRVLALLLPLGLVTLLVACSSPSPVASSPTPNLATQFRQLMAPTNTADIQLSKDLFLAPPPSAQVRADAKALSVAEIQLKQSLLVFEAQLPSNQQADAETFRDSMTQQIIDLQAAAASTNDTDLHTALHAWTQDVMRSGFIEVKLQNDLGIVLHPPSANP